MSHKNQTVEQVLSEWVGPADGRPASERVRAEFERLNEEIVEQRQRAERSLLCLNDLERACERGLSRADLAKVIEWKASIREQRLNLPGVPPPMSARPTDVVALLHCMFAPPTLVTADGYGVRFRDGAVEIFRALPAEGKADV